METKYILGILGATALGITLVWAAEPASPAATVTVDSMPPSVVKTTPAAGVTDVDPALQEIRVTFSKVMMTNRMWAVVQTSKETFPEIDGSIRFLDDQRTCVIPVKLVPGKTYVLWFNLGKFNSFRDTHNTPAVPYQLVFHTRASTP